MLSARFRFIDFKQTIYKVYAYIKMNLSLLNCKIQL